MAVAVAVVAAGRLVWAGQAVAPALLSCSGNPVRCSYVFSCNREMVVLGDVAVRVVLAALVVLAERLERLLRAHARLVPARAILVAAVEAVEQVEVAAEVEVERVAQASGSCSVQILTKVPDRAPSPSPRAKAARAVSVAAPQLLARTASSSRPSRFLDRLVVGPQLSTWKR